MNLLHERDIEIERESFGDLLRDLRDEVMIMIRQQIELAKTETNEKISKLMKNAGALFAGGLVLYAGFLFLITGLTFLGYQGLLAAGVSTGLSMWLAPLITAVVIGGIGAILVFKAINTFKKASFTPGKTIHTIKEDQKWITKKRR